MNTQRLTVPPDLTIPPGLLTTGDVATVFRTSESTIRYWRQQKTGPRSFKAGRRVLYRSEDVSAYLDHLIEAGSSTAS